MCVRFARFVPVALLALFITAGCDSNEEDAPGTVTVQMNHTVSGDDLALNSLQYTNTAGNLYSVSLLEYIITNVTLQTAGGGAVALSEVQYVNADDASSQRFSAPDIAGGTYSGITFTFGIDGARNTTGALPNTTVFNNMAWPAGMGGGYHYMRLEGRFQGDAGEGGFAVHTGPTMGADYSFDVTLPANIRVDGGETVVEVEMDVNEWFGNPNIYDFRDVQGGIMGNASLQQVLQANGMDIFSIGSVE